MTIKTTFGKITANRHLLNIISIAFMESAEYNDEIKCRALAEEARKTSEVIYKALETSGFYKDC